MTNYDDNSRQDDWATVYEIEGHSRLTNDDRIWLEAMLTRPGVGGGLEISRRLLRGYALYHFGAALSSTESCEGDLLAVLNDDPANLTALTYLGHFYFDCGKWDLARANLRRVDLDRYDAEGQVWRTIKIRELIACCDVMMNDFRAAAAEIPPLLDEMSRVNDSDCPIPVELIKSLAANVISARQGLGSRTLDDWTGKLRALAAAFGATEQFREAFAKLERRS